MFLLVRFRRAAAAAVPLCSPEKEERLHDKHLSRRSRHPAGAFSRYCTFQSKDGGEIWRQYSQTPPLWRILTWRQRHIQKEPGYKWNTTWLYSQYSAFPLKIQILGFFSRRAAPCCIFVIHNPSVKHYITETPLLLLGVIDAFLSAYCFFFITLERIKKKQRWSRFITAALGRPFQINCRGFSNPSSPTYMTDGVIKIEVSSTSRASRTKGNDET